MLLEARGEDGRALGDEELFDHMFTLLMAGHETTATTTVSTPTRTNVADIVRPLPLLG